LSTKNFSIIIDFSIAGDISITTNSSITKDRSIASNISGVSNPATTIRVLMGCYWTFAASKIILGHIEVSPIFIGCVYNTLIHSIMIHVKENIGMIAHTGHDCFA
jgi:hypothetical protein